MKRLKQLVKVINRLKVNQINVIGNTKRTTNMTDEFYQKLTSNDFETDDEAAQYFFKTNSSNRNYKLLKKRLETNLLNTVFFIDAKKNNFSPSQKAYYSIIKELTAAKVLEARGVAHLSVDIIKKCLSRSERYKFTEFAYESAKMLKYYYGMKIRNNRDYCHYRDLAKSYKELLMIEDLATEYFVEVDFYYENDRINLANGYNFCKVRYEELAPYLDKYDSHRLHLPTRIIEVQMHSLNRDIPAMLSACQTSIAYFKEKDIPIGIQMFTSKMALAYYELQEYEKGIAAIETSLKMHPSKSTNWFNDMHFYMLLKLHTKDYLTAYEILLSVTKVAEYNNLPKNIQEFWKIAEAYLYLLIEAGKLQVEKNKRFRIGKLLNEVPSYASDKRVTNVPVLIIQILYMLQGASKSPKKQNNAIDRINAIEQYCGRYLRKDNNYRSNCFIKMLLQIPAGYFNKKAIERRVEKYVAKLAESEVEFVTQTYEIELIPYEDLWEIALESL